MADFSDPFVFLVPRKMSPEELVRALRMDIADEIEAINVYESHLNATDNENARRVLAHVIGEEKEHLAEFLEVVKQLDPEQLQELEEAPADVAAIVAQRPESNADQSAPQAAPPSPSVGSLIERDGADGASPDR